MYIFPYLVESLSESATYTDSVQSRPRFLEFSFDDCVTMIWYTFGAHSRLFDHNDKEVKNLAAQFFSVEILKNDIVSVTN